MTRLIFLSLAWFFVALGVLGIILPVLPTTPFLLVAVWAFSRSSPELAAKLRNNRYAGPYIRDWQDSGVIPIQAKVLAITMMSAAVLYLALGTELPQWAVALTGAILLGVGAYIITRPSLPPPR